MLILPSISQVRDFACDQLPKFSERVWFIREQIALGASILLYPDDAFGDASVDPRRRDFQFRGQLGNGEVAVRMARRQASTISARRCGARGSQKRLSKHTAAPWICRKRCAISPRMWSRTERNWRGSITTWPFSSWRPAAAIRPKGLFSRPASFGEHWLTIRLMSPSIDIDSP